MHALLIDGRHAPYAISLFPSSVPQMFRRIFDALHQVFLFTLTSLSHRCYGGFYSAFTETPSVTNNLNGIMRVDAIWQNRVHYTVPLVVTRGYYLHASIYADSHKHINIQENLMQSIKNARNIWGIKLYPINQSIKSFLL